MIICNANLKAFFLSKTHFVFLMCTLLLTACSSGTQESIFNEMPPAPYTDNSPRFTSFDLFSPNSQTAQSFYNTVFGWTFENTEDNDQVTIVHNHHVIGTIINYEVDKDGTDNARWISNLAIPNFDAVLSNVKKLGGIISAGPENDSLRGKIAIIEDPTGAELLLSETKNTYQKSKNQVEGDFVWIDLFTNNKQPSAEFYTAIAGFNMLTDPSVPEHVYFVSDHNIRAGMVVYSWEDVAPNWLPYIGVKDVVKTIRMAYDAGGNLLIKSGKSAVIEDPTGAAIGIFEIGNGGQQ